MIVCLSVLISLTNWTNSGNRGTTSLWFEFFGASLFNLIKILETSGWRNK